MDANRTQPLCEGNAGMFPQTSWTLIRLSQEVAKPEALQALDSLARAYWRPLYSSVRAMGYTHEQSEDEVQLLFQRLVSRDSLRLVVQGETRFRSFMIACLKNTLASSARERLALKRGGGAVMEPLDDTLQAETVFPETTLDREWAREVFERAFAALEADAARRGKGEALGILRPMLRGELVVGGYAALAERLSASEGAVRKMAFDLRARLGRLIRNEVEATVADPAEVAEELRYLLSLL